MACFLIDGKNGPFRKKTPKGLLIKYAQTCEMNQPRDTYVYKTCVPINDPLGQAHSLPVAITVLAWKLFCLVWFWIVETDVRTDVQTTRAKIMITTGRDCGSASWIICICSSPIEEEVIRKLAKKGVTNHRCEITMFDQTEHILLLLFQIFSLSLQGYIVFDPQGRATYGR